MSQQPSMLDRKPMSDTALEKERFVNKLRNSFSDFKRESKIKGIDRMTDHQAARYVINGDANTLDIPTTEAIEAKISSRISEAIEKGRGLSSEVLFLLYYLQTYSPNKDAFEFLKSRGWDMSKEAVM